MDRLLILGTLLGIVATLVMDLSNKWLAGTGFIGKSDPRFLGRVFYQWAHGRFVHSSPAAIPQISREYLYGTVGHYAIGAVLATAYLLISRALWGNVEWRLPAVGYGVATSVFAWFLLFPSVGFGLFGTKAPPKIQVFRTSFVNHVWFGVGLSLGAFAIGRWGLL
jgi:hypothetical protein